LAVPASVQCTMTHNMQRKSLHDEVKGEWSNIFYYVRK